MPDAHTPLNAVLPAHVSAAEHELAEHCMIFHEVYEEDLKMIQEYLDTIDALCEVRYQSAYSHWRKLLAEMLQGTQTLKEHVPLQNEDAFHESLRAFSFLSAIRFLKDIGNICGIKLEREWAERFQANILLIMQAHQQYQHDLKTS